MLAEFKESSFFHFLDVLGKLVAPSGVAVLFCKLFKVPDRINYVVSFGLFAVSAVILFGRKYLKNAWSSLSLALAIALAVSLVLSWSRPSDAFSALSKDFLRDIEDCPAHDDRCLALAMSHIRRPSFGSPLIRLSNDLRAAAICMQNKRTAEMLNRQLGIKSSFLGSGLTEPTGEDSYSAAKIPEYFVPNYDDSKDCVWTWQIPVFRINPEQTLKDFVKSNQPLAVQGRKKFGNFDFQRIERGLSLISSTPSVVRLAQFPAGQYSRHLGRPDAKWVFTIHLGAVWEMKIKDVAKYSGYQLTVSPREQDALFIWIVAPFSADEVVPATWANIFSHIDGWVQ